MHDLYIYIRMTKYWKRKLSCLHPFTVCSVLLGLVSKDQMLKKLYNSLFNEIDTVMKGDKMVSTL